MATKMTAPRGPLIVTCILLVAAITATVAVAGHVRVVPAVTTQTLTVAPSADSYVARASPNTNYGSATQLQVGTSPTFRSYLLFNVAGVSGTVTSVQLVLHATTAGSGFGLRQSQSTPWAESTITWANAPAFGPVLKHAGSFTGGSTVIISAGSIVSGNGVYTIVLTSASTTPIGFATREAGDSVAPQLVITQSIPTPTPAPTATPSPTPTPTVTPAGFQAVELVVEQNGQVVEYNVGTWTVFNSFSLGALRDVRGVAVDYHRAILYVSYGPFGGTSGTTGGHLLAWSLTGNALIYDVAYSHPIDSFALTPDGTAIYMPYGEGGSPTSANPVWYVINPADGSQITTIDTSPGACAHDGAASLDGSIAFLGDRCYNYLVEAATATNQIVKLIGPLNSGVRPYTFNKELTRAYTTASYYFGFQEEDLTTGNVLYTVPMTSTTDPPNFYAPNHGIALSDDEATLWVADQPNCAAHRYDVTGVPAETALIFFQGNCSYMVTYGGWLNMSRDGHYLYAGNNGSVVDTTTSTVVTVLPAMAQTRQYLELDYQDGVLVYATGRMGLGGY